MGIFIIGIESNYLQVRGFFNDFSPPPNMVRFVHAWSVLAGGLGFSTRTTVDVAAGPVNV